MIYPDEFHDLGERLLDNYGNLCNDGEDANSIAECVFRTIIDRAYYGAFLEARDWLKDNENFTPTRTGVDHDLVRMELKTANIDNGASLAGRLGTLKRDRGKASYHLSGGFSGHYNKEDTEAILKLSKRVIDAFR